MNLQTPKGKLGLLGALPKNLPQYCKLAIELVLDLPIRAGDDLFGSRGNVVIPAKAGVQNLRLFLLMYRQTS